MPRGPALRTLWQALQRALLIGLCLLLGACASAPTAAHARGVPAAHAARPMLPGPGSAVPPEVAGRGGYYLDDGPGNGPPVDPATVPDAVPRDEPVLPNANRPYEALGEVYFPDTSLLPYAERGIASWYGRRFHGHRTSSGEPYDMYAMTGAHKTLPIPSYVRVTDVLSGKSVVVRINDRGPFHPGRVIDLSYTAAAKLGIASRGSAEVLVERVFPAGLGDLPAQADASLPGGSANAAAGAGGSGGGAPGPGAAGAGTPRALASAAGAAGTGAVATALPLTLPTAELVTPVAPPPGARIPSPQAGDALPARAGTPLSDGPGTPADARLADAAPPTPPATRPEDSIVAADALPPTAGAGASAGGGAAATGAGGLFVQLGAFRDANNARQLLARARSALSGLQSFLKLEVAGGLHRVRLGPFPTARAQNAAAAAVERSLHMKPGLIGP